MIEELLQITPSRARQLVPQCAGWSVHNMREALGPLAFTPYGREPWLLVARESRWPIIMPYFDKTGSANVIASGAEIEETAIAVASKAFFVVSSRV